MPHTTNDAKLREDTRSAWHLIDTSPNRAYVEVPEWITRTTLGVRSENARTRVNPRTA